MSSSSVAEVIAGAYAKLDWAKSRHAEMFRLFDDYLYGEAGAPFTIEFDIKTVPQGLVVARFRQTRPLPDEMSMLAGDLVHNTRVALDHTLAALKEHFGGHPGRGSFPICREPSDWDEQVTARGRRSPLHGLADAAADLVHSEQPMHRAEPIEDPLSVLNRLDNTDKHRRLHVAFAYTDAQTGLDLVEVLDPPRVKRPTSKWRQGEPLNDGKVIATFFIRQGRPTDLLKANDTARTGFATGEFDQGHVDYDDMIERVRGILGRAKGLIEST